MNKMFQLPTYRVPFFMFLCTFGLTSLLAQSVTEGFRLKKMEGETVRWELEADSAKFVENLKTLQGIKVKFYPKNKEPFIIKSEEGWVKETDKDEIYLKKNVQVTGYLKSDINCESLYWDSVSGLIYTQDKVEIEGEKWHIKGEGIEFSPSGDVMTIKKNVTMEIKEK